MTTRLTPYGSADHAHNVSKVGKGKTPGSLAARMPSLDVASKVGIEFPKLTTPLSLAARMPSPQIAAKVGTDSIAARERTRRLVRRNATS